MTVRFTNIRPIRPSDENIAQAALDAFAMNWPDVVIAIDPDNPEIGVRACIRCGEDFMFRIRIGGQPKYCDNCTRY